MLWLALNFYQLPLDVFYTDWQDDSKPLSEQQNMPVFAIAENSRIAYANPAARAVAIEPGIKLATAYALSSQLVIKQRQPSLEKSYLNQLANLLYAFSSQVCIYNEQSILLELQASCRLFDGLELLLNKIAQRLEEVSPNYYVGFAASAKAAFLNALYFKQTLADFIPQLKDLSLDTFIEEQQQRFRQIPIVLLAQEPNFQLAPLVNKISKMGLTEMDELLALSDGALGRRLGLRFVDYLARLKGLVADPLVLFEPAEVFSMQLCFLDGLDQVQQILFPARRLLSCLCRFLQIRRLMASEIVWYLTDFNGTDLYFKISLSAEVQNYRHLVEVTQLKLQGIELKQKIETLGLEVKQFLPLQEAQKSLLDSILLVSEASQSPSKNIEPMMDKLKVRLGEQACLGLFIKNEHLAEQYSFLQSVKDLSNFRSKLDPIELCNSHKLQPLWLFQSPQKITAYSLPIQKIPRKSANKLSLQWLTESSQPIGLNYKGPLFLISQLEKVSSHWWADFKKRDYYICKNNRGNFYWIFYDRVNKGWFVQGVF